MDTVLEVKGLCKEYPKFKLEDVSFSIEKGSITGLIGRNGAGKTTTMKSILRLVHPTKGSVVCFGMDMENNEAEIKRRLGYAGGAVDYYRKKKIKNLAAITKSFYPSWDDELYRKYMDMFSLDEEKTPSELSEGMKVKLNLALALSHGAELLILDEPTSGLDPVSREELLELFKYLAGKGVAILFSTHITSDLDKCADKIVYIKSGRIMYSGSKEDYIASCGEKGIGSNLEEIMLHYEMEAFNEKLK